MDKVAVVAITKNGVKIGRKIGGIFPDWEILAPEKLSDGHGGITWYSESTTQKIAKMFKHNDAMVCIFSLGAVIRLIAPHLDSKKTDPAVIVIDDKVNFVISVLSGHLGGANELTREIASKMGSVPVITTAADVNKTIAVDMVGKELGWKIDDDSTVTKISAHMVNEEMVGIFQDAGEKDWHGPLPGNVKLFEKLDEMINSDAKGFLVISDRKMEGDFLRDSVVYRPPSLVIGIGLHRDTAKETIIKGIESCLDKFGLSLKSVSRLASIKKQQDVWGLIEAGQELGIDIEYVDRKELAGIDAPNPSDTVRAFEGTSSVSEAAAIKVSGGSLIVEKQKLPPDLTIAIARKTE